MQYCRGGYEVAPSDSDVARLRQPPPCKQFAPWSRITCMKVARRGRGDKAAPGRPWRAVVSKEMCNEAETEGSDTTERKQSYVLVTHPCLRTLLFGQ